MPENKKDKVIVKANVVLFTFAFCCLVPFCLNGQVNWTYSINHLKMPTTKLRFSIEDTVLTNGSEYFDLQVTAKNQGVFKFLFRVDNEYLTQIQTESFLPLETKKLINQKNIHEDTVIRYDQKSHIAIKDSAFTWQIPEKCHNYFSMLFFLRNKPLLSGDTYSFNLDVEYLVWQVEANVEAIEQLKIKSQNYPAIRVKLDYKSPGKTQKRPWKTDILTNRIAKKGGSMIIWFSADVKRLILRVDYDSETKMYLSAAE